MALGSLKAQGASAYNLEEADNFTSTCKLVKYITQSIAFSILVLRVPCF